MAPKYTILKVILQIFSKIHKSSRGFTLLELIAGLSIMLIVGSLALNAFVNANAGVSKDKKSIESSQNMSVILEMIGTDIKQAGENISDNSFPTIEFTLATASDPTLTTGSSKIIIRRAVSNALTLCQSIPANTNPSSTTTLTVADNSPSVTDPNCNVGTASSQLQAARPYANIPNATYQLVPGTLTPLPPTLTPPTAIPSPALLPILPIPLRNARDYRCTLDDLNPTIAYDDPTQVAQDFCGGVPAEKVRVAMSDGNGHIIIFNQTGETDVSSATVAKYSIAVNALSSVNPSIGFNQATIDNNTKNKAVAYSIGNPIYLIEERAYTLTNTGELQLSINGGASTTLIKKIANFKISAKGYIDISNNRIINPTPPVPAADICLPAPSSPTVNDPQYICKLNYNTLVTAPAMNWKMIAGMRVELQAKYDGTGQNAVATATDTDKLKVAAEFIPRNILSR
jgi:prepilin-type N-terminal cleavage/methylation domain-containing protein